MPDLVKAAAQFAGLMHTGQLRKWSGEPYFHHPKRVAALLVEFGYGDNDQMIAAAWLHDVLEDCNVSDIDIEGRFGAVVTLFVQQLTKPARPMLAQTQTIKVADIADNLRNIAEVAPPAEAMAYILAKERQLDTLTLADPELWIHARRVLVGQRQMIEAMA